ncbi:hypothetical protein [Paenimyroides aestuarii]|uniref:Uncharacterized protein n=1 Tax=Paenimyroides aestuarii TaxID=2968490 RepID=A0ABY5NV08_9FLAO|nr:hypothetical protein [Paenimyroides aestuarii]UUV22292.1 hypothetical protein NPX36_04450 [Paenimyroides aestuarii]
MNLRLLFVVFLMLSLSCTAQDKRLTGKWKGTDSQGGTVCILFSKDGYVTFINGKNTFGGKEFEIEGIKAACKYIADFSKTPHQIDYVFYNLANNNEINRMRGIYRFLGYDKMELRVNMNGGTYSEFAEIPDMDTLFLEKK